MLSTIVVSLILAVCWAIGIFLAVVFYLNRRLQADVDESYLHNSLPPQSFVDEARQAGEASLRSRRRLGGVALAV